MMRRLLMFGALLLLVVSMGFTAVECSDCEWIRYYRYCSTSACPNGPYFGQKTCDLYKKMCWNPPDEYDHWWVHCSTENCTLNGNCCDYPD